MAEQNDAMHEVVINRWEREIERNKARAEASEANFRKTLAEQIKQENIRKAVIADAHAATKDVTRHTSSRNLDSLRESFANRGYYSDEVITGNEEWLKD